MERKYAALFVLIQLVFDCIRMNLPGICNVVCKHSTTLEFYLSNGTTPFGFGMKVKRVYSQKAAMVHAHECLLVLASNGADLDPVHSMTGMTPLQELSKYNNASSRKTFELILQLQRERLEQTRNYQAKLALILQEATSTDNEQFEAIPKEVIELIASYTPLYLCERYFQ